MPPSNMSVFHRGGSYLHRRLSKLYSDTKQSYETATVAISREDDPDMASLQKEYRIQKDRLLGWGLEWSDSNTGQFPDVQIDDSVDEAGFSDVVAFIMSTIQDLLMQSEKLQKAFENHASGGTNQGPLGNFSANDKNSAFQSSDSEHAQRSRLLLAELTACIDYLFKLSDTRRARRKGFREVSISKDSFIKDLQQVQSRSSFQSEASERTLVDPTPVNVTRPPQASLRQPGFSHFIRANRQQNSLPSEPESMQNQQTSVCARALQINESAVSAQPDTVTEDASPPTYDAAVGASIIRTFAWIDGGRLSEDERSKLLKTANLACGAEDEIKLIIETTPFQPSDQTTVPEQGPEELSSLLNMWGDQHGRPAIDKSPHLISYFRDNDQCQHISVYRAPKNSQPAQPTIVPYHTEVLNSLFLAGNDSSDNHMPSLENRFRLAFDLATSAFQFRLSGISHGGINSSNVLVMSTKETRPPKHHSPMLLSQLSFSRNQEDEAHETFSAMIYRHPQEQALQKAELWASDTYSLGLVLLEIGLWTPLRRLWKTKYDRETFRSRIRSVYTQKLASRCGTAYMDAVNLCIDAVERRSENSPIDYASNIVNILSRCCAIDVEGESTEPTVRTFRCLAREEIEQNELTSENNTGSPAEQPAEQRISSSDALPSRSKNNANEAAETQALSESSTVPAASKKVLLKKWDTIDIPQADLDQWNNSLMPRLSKILQQILGDSSESCSASLMMVGKSAETAKTTICIQCSSVDRVRKALKENFKCKKGWGLVVLRGDVSRSKRPRRRGIQAQFSGSKTEQTRDVSQVDSFYQQRPAAGASIGAYRDFEHLPPVSFGGSIIVDGQVYGMTVHHMLDSPEEAALAQQAVQRSAAVPNSGWEDLAYVGGASETAQDPSLLELTHDEALDFDRWSSTQDDFWFSEIADLTEDDSEYSDTEDDASSIGDIEGVDPTEADEDLIVTQPAIDDVEEDFFPNLEDRDDDHLSSHTLGYVYASSGIRRVSRKGIKHEVDWALIKINPDRLPTQNSLPTTTSSPSHSDLTQTITRITPTHLLPSTLVSCHARTSGPNRHGRISPALALVKMHGRTSFSSSWCVDGGRFGVPGDSGAWVFDPVEKSLCGHVLAWGDRSKVAFIAPMEVLFEDIEKRIGSKVELPAATMSTGTVANTEATAKLEVRVVVQSPAAVLDQDDDDEGVGEERLSLLSEGSNSTRESLSDKLSIDLDLSTFQNLSLDHTLKKDVLGADAAAAGARVTSIIV